MARIIELEVGCCGDCPYYNCVKDKCLKGAEQEGKQFDSFFADCPLKWREV